MSTYRDKEGTMNRAGFEFHAHVQNALLERIREEVEAGASVEELVGMTASAVMDTATSCSIGKRLRPDPPEVFQLRTRTLIRRYCVAPGWVNKGPSTFALTTEKLKKIMTDHGHQLPDDEVVLRSYLKTCVESDNGSEVPTE